MIEMDDRRHAVMPQDKLIQLSLYKQLVEAKPGISVPWGSFPDWRSAVFFKGFVYRYTIDRMNDEVFRWGAEIIEIDENPAIPIGELGPNVTGSVQDIPDACCLGATLLRAIHDIGLLNMQRQYLVPDNLGVVLIEAG